MIQRERLFPLSFLKTILEKDLFSPVKSTAPPNILLFMADQLSAKWLEAARAGACPTPNLDRLAARGTTFTNCISSNPVCCPARATLATGLSSRSHGLLENGYALDPEIPTFMQILQKAGYRTGGLGKIHLRPHWESLYPDYRPYGFDVVHGAEDDRGGEWLDWVRYNHPDQLDNVLATVWASEMEEFQRYGPEKIDLQSRIQSIQKSFQWATPNFPRNTADAHALPFPEEISQTHWITERGVEFLHSAPFEAPFFTQISYVQPHHPYAAPGRLFQEVDTSKIPSPLDPEWKADPHAPLYLREIQPEIAEDWDWQRHCYFADIIHLDEQLGKVLDTLEETGKTENTLVIFLSDHGDLLQDHGCYGKEGKHYDACVRVPLIIAEPGQQESRTFAGIVQLEDICPTILDYAGESMPPLPHCSPYLDRTSDEIEVLPGFSLKTAIQGRTDPLREVAYIESYNPIAHYDYRHWVRSIRTPEFRYSYYAGGGGEQLFDLRANLSEQENLAEHPNFQTVKQELRFRLLEEVIAQDYPKTRRDLFSLGVH